MIQALPLRALAVLALFLGAVFAIEALVSAPHAQATTLADEIICEVFTELNELGEPIPDLDHDGCPDVEPPPPPPPPPPTCGEGEHLEGETCVPDESQGGGETGGDTSPPVDNPAPAPTGGGSGAPSYVPPSTSGAPTIIAAAPEVLGAATSEETLGESCGIYMNSYLRMGNPANDAAQVTKLQEFLNRTMGAGLPVTGYFGPLTEKAVKLFQSAHADTILTPWSIAEPTGLVYLTTAYEINRIECPSLTLSLPSLVPWSENTAL